jgi:hypothetical protein
VPGRALPTKWRITMNSRLTAPRNDQILGLTRALAAFIVPFLVAAFGILYLFPGQAPAWWAFPMEARISGFWMGAGYLAGAYFFVRALWARRWHHVAVGFWPVGIFASLLGLATLLDWNGYSHGRPAFAAWSLLYFTTPFLVPLVWWLNRSADGGAFDVPDAVLAGPVRRVMALVSAGIIGAGLFLFIWPRLAVTFWPWSLSPLAARVMGAWFVLPGIFGVTVARERRWSAVRYAIQSQALGVALILLGVLLTWRELDTGNVLTWLLVMGMVGLLVVLAWLYVAYERRAQASPLVPA